MLFRSREIALLCKKYKVPVVCSSDAHFYIQIGKVQPALDMLKEIEFPEEMILNIDVERFQKIAQEKSPKKQ